MVDRPAATVQLLQHVLPPAGASAKAASAASRAACFMRPCSEVTARPFAAGRRPRTVRRKSTQAQVRKYTMTLDSLCSCSQGNHLRRTI